MKVLNLFFIVLFVLSAVLQYNDPDPYIWIPLYLYGAFVCYKAVRRKLVPALYIVGWIVYGAYALYLFFGDDGVLSWWQEHQAENIAQSMKATNPWIEETREFFGLLILLLALLLNWLWLRREETNARKTVNPSHKRIIKTER
ncbi:MAG TPA: transmembrane 220 family protein [Flavisolibacter sp.]|jgi:H+/Cl- antiporter ClcA|nr:transmembrane 220 family protein [Flavisolibacter sp.]